ncbi:DNA internalization-related competence protein ComEC/Rec2 [Oscillospiraceae bacterium WX1]
MRKLATAAASFSAAVFISLKLLPPSFVLIAAAAAAALSLFGLLLRIPARRRFFLIALSLSAGFLWVGIYKAVFYEPARQLDGQTRTVSAVVCDAPLVTDTVTKLPVAVSLAGHPAVRTQLYLYDDDSVSGLAPGNTITVTARFRLADTLYGEETDVFLSKGVYLFGTVTGPVSVTEKSTPVLFFPARVAAAVRDEISGLFPADIAGLMRALIIGDTSQLSRASALSAALSVTGTTHIISVSGMNIAFLMGLIGLLIKNRRARALVGIPVVFVFMAVVGFAPPVTRAGIMQIFILTAPFVKRENDPVTALSAALLLILLFNPFAVGSIGLQLSFLSTLGMILVTERLDTSLLRPLARSKILQRRFLKGIVRYVAATLAATVGALVFTLPLIALSFGTVSLVAPITNIAVLWACEAAFCLGVAAVVLGFIWFPLGAAAAFPASLLARLMTAVIEFFGHTPLAAVYTANPAITVWLVALYIIFGAVLLLRLSKRHLIVPICLSSVALCIILTATAFYFDSPALSVTALQIGQGQCLVLTSRAATVVIDCGSSSGKDAADILTKYLQSRGRTTVDLLILTHFHADHANGVCALLSREKVSAILMPDSAIDSGTLSEDIRRTARAHDVAVVEMTQNCAVTAADTVLHVYAPLGDGGENERGLSILCSSGDFDALITGDMNAAQEKRLLASAELPDIELLIVGHHGSKTATSEDLLQAVSPEIAVISVGYNTYGHPAPETLKRLYDRGILVYRTDEAGPVTIKSSA